MSKEQLGLGNLLKNKLKNKFSLAVSIIIIGYVLSFPFLNGWMNPITWDGFGYYLYLPMTFIYGDLGISDYSVIDTVTQEQFVSTTVYQIYKTETGNWIIRYPMGVAALQSPFYLFGHLFAKIGGYHANGFTPPYQVSLICGGIFYFSMGIMLLRKILLRWFSDIVTTVVLVALFFGTNLENQAVLSVAMPHVLIFFLYTVIVWYTIKWHEKSTLFNSIILGGTIGLATICRPTEVVSILIPIFWGVQNPLKIWNKIKDQLLNNRKYVLIVIISFIVLVFMQMLYWKVYAGKFVFNSYNNPGEGLDLLSPHTFNSLFSFRKGWFIYTPIMVFFVLSFIWFKKQKPQYFWSFFLYFILNLYLVSSWTNWWYAGSFGQRALVQSYAVLAIVFAFFVGHLIKKNNKIKIAFLALLLLLFVGLNLFQSWQYKKGIIHDSRMTFDYYMASFLKTTKLDSEKDKLLIYDRDLTFEQAMAIYDYHQEIIFQTDFKDEYFDRAYSKNGALLIDTSNEYSTPYKIEFGDITNNDNAWIKIEFMYFTTDTVGNLSIVNLIENNEGNYGYTANNIFLDIKPNSEEKWRKKVVFYSPPVIRNYKDKYVTYFWNVSKNETAYIDDLKITVFKIK